MIPIAADGLKPFTAYAGGTDADRARAARMPSIAIVIGGLGVGAAKTSDAIMKLPPAVTLAFTPYGSDPGQAGGARPRATPRGAAANSDGAVRLSRQRPRAANPAHHVGRRAESRPPVLAPQPIPGLCRDRQFHGRALCRHRCGDAAYSARGRQARARLPRRRVCAAQRRLLAGGGPGDAVRQADFSIDAVPTSVEIDRALAKLERLAKERGTAVGIASALPISIERIAAWTRSLESRGILLVPLTTAMLKSKSS